MVGMLCEGNRVCCSWLIGGVVVVGFVFCIAVGEEEEEKKKKTGGARRKARCCSGERISAKRARSAMQSGVAV